MIDIRHKNIRKNSLPRTGRGIDAVGGTGSSSSSVFIGGGGSVTVEADLDILAGSGIDISKSNVDKLTYTVSHSDTSDVENTSNKDVFFIQNLKFDGFGHIVEVDSVRITAGLDERYLRKDVDDTAHGNILFDQRIGSSVFLNGMDGKGWEIKQTGSAFLDSVMIRKNAIIGSHAGSEIFVSGFPSGLGWDLGPYKRFNAAGVEETKYRLELDDLIVRGKLRVFEMIISQLRGENDNVIFAGQMKVAFYDAPAGRLYLDTDKGILYNPFRPGDILMVQRFGGLPSAGNNYNVIKQYELRVNEAGVGSLSDGENRLDWITFTNFVGELADIAVGDVLTRVDSVSDSTRKGIVKVTTIDEIGAPYIDVVYGMKTDPLHSTKARMGNLSGIRTKNQMDLTGVWGLYAEGAILENSTFYLDNGMTVEQQFTVMNGELNSKIEGVKNDMSLEQGNILRNSSFSSDTNYWRASGEVHFIKVGSDFLWLDGSFYTEKKSVADIYRDGSKNVLRILNTCIRQSNDVMNGEKVEGTYSFSFFYKVLRAGTLSAGIEGTELYLNQSLSESAAYQKLSKAGTWNGTGDFKLQFTGEILIYGVSLFNDALADATIKLQTQIQQNAERISLTATKEYVDSETGEIYLKYDSELKVQADEISQRVTKTEYETGTNTIKREWESKLSVQADRISAVSREVDNVNHTISESGWITAPEANTLYASKTLEDGNKIISYINQTATTTTISAQRINLYGAVSFQMFDPSLQNRVNAKADVSDVSQALRNYVTSSDLTGKLKEYTLASTLSDYVKSGYLSTTLASYATNTAADAKAKAEAKAAFNTLTDAMINGKTSVIGGLISASVLDVDSIFANQAKIGAFKIYPKNDAIYANCFVADMHDGGKMILNPSGGLIFNGVTKTARFGVVALSSSTGSDAMVFLDHASVSTFHDVMYICSNAWMWNNFISCVYSTGQSLRSIILGTYHFDNDASWFHRTTLKLSHLPSRSQIATLSGTGNRYNVMWDEGTGHLYVDY